MNKVMEKAPVEQARNVTPVNKGWQAFEGLRGEVDRLFRDFEHGSWFTPGRLFDIEPFRSGTFTRGLVPPVDVTEKDKVYEIAVELPGLDEKDVEVTYHEGMLTIRGEKKEETEEERMGLQVSERRYGSFERTFRVPEDANHEKVEAEFRKGVLMITLPKSAEKRQREKKIAVKAA